jgi:hypothetical protein
MGSKQCNLGVKQKELLKSLGWTVELGEYQALLAAGRSKDGTATQRRMALYQLLKDKLDTPLWHLVEKIPP